MNRVRADFPALTIVYNSSKESSAFTHICIFPSRYSFAYSKGSSIAIASSIAHGLATLDRHCQLFKYIDNISVNGSQTTSLPTPRLGYYFRNLIPAIKFDIIIHFINAFDLHK